MVQLRVTGSCQTSQRQKKSVSTTFMTIKGCMDYKNLQFDINGVWSHKSILMSLELKK